MLWVTKLLAAAAILGVGTPTWSVPRPPLNPHVTVYVSDGAQTSPRSLAHAEREAGRIFQSAGITLDWIDCTHLTDQSTDAGCHRTPIPGELAIRILPRARQAPDSVFGTSFLDRSGGTYADIFLDRVQQLRELDPSLTLEPILGDVLAHELGHLLLGTGSHAPTGLMQANWKYPQLRLIEMGQLSFSPKEAALLRARLASLQNSSLMAHAAATGVR
jgi:hypothetical protein